MAQKIESVRGAFQTLQSEPSRENLQKLIESMHKTGTNYTQIPGMSKEFARDFLHSKKFERKPDNIFLQKLKSCLPQKKTATATL